ncbi:MAG: SIS domain-containing protein [Phycisphaerales bacterium]|nr:SIS domain-containing protein [Phycisphaerales bacterium]
MSRPWADVLAEHQRVIAALCSHGEVVDAIADRITTTFAAGGRVLIFGNGGSAADSQHIAAELLGRFKRDRAPAAAIALTTDTSILTAVANDLGYEHVFERQVRGIGRPGDVAIAISTSGGSATVLNAMRAAREIGMIVIGLTGERGAAMADMCDLAFIAPHTQSDRIQECHQLAYHYICERVESRLPQ